MTLDAAERTRTRDDLAAALRTTGMDAATVASALGLSTGEVQATLYLHPRVRPAEVWLVRDFLDRELRTTGRGAPSWGVLTDEARTDAAGWYRLRELPAS